MRTTTVVWNNITDLTPDQGLATKQRREEAAVALAGELYRSGLERTISPDGSTIAFKRAWPDLATAEAWVAYSLNEGAVSAVVDPE